jgi:hypothetical protein
LEKNQDRQRCGKLKNKVKIVQVVSVEFSLVMDEQKNILFSHLLTYLLTPWNRVLLDKLTGFAASQEIPRIYGTRKFITVLTSARHLGLS